MRVRYVLLVAVTASVLAFAPPVSADTGGTDAVVDAATAEAACEAFFGVGPGVEPLSACQWGMRAVQAGPASYAQATGAGVSVGVIDSGVDTTHADVAPNLDLARSCSFIFSDTPTAAPAEVANGDCSNKSAVQDLQGHGTHVSTIIAGADNGIGVAGVAPRGHDRGTEGVHHPGVLLRRLGGRRLAVRGGPAPRCREPQSVRRSVPVLLQERGRAADDPQGHRERGALRPAAGCRDRRVRRQRVRRPRPSHDRRDQPRLAARLGGGARGAQQLPGGARRDPGSDHRVGLRPDDAGELFERRLAGRGDCAGRRRGTDAGHHLRAGPLRLVEHRPVRPVGGALRRQPGRARRREPVRVGQRHVDVVAARRGGGRAGQRTPPRLEPGGGRRRGAPLGDAALLPGRLAR